VNKIRVAVCQNPPEMTVCSSEWSTLCERGKLLSPALLLLNELPFGRWISAGKRFDRPSWTESQRQHEAGVRQLANLGAKSVALTVPSNIGRRHVNEACIWTKRRGMEPVHTKQYFPNEAGFYEARWFQAGPRHFRIASAGSAKCGFLICTELMFNQHARQYGRSGAQLILVPRATGSSLERWLVALRMAAIVSGCYVLSSNRGGTGPAGQVFGGCGSIIGPKGDLIAQTSAQEPLVSAEIDLQDVKSAQKDYPCYVQER